MDHPHRKNVTFRTCFKHFWLKTELYFTPTCSLDKWKSPMLEFMQSLREQGYHKKLLAQHTMYTLILSRSAIINRSKGETYIRLRIEDVSKIGVYFDSKDEEIRFEQNTLEITSEIRSLINKLLKVPINVIDEERLVQRCHNSIISERHLQDAPIPIRFKNAWLKIERFYTPHWSSQEWQRSVLALLQSLREQGYHKRLRAGQSLYDLILSRSSARNLRGGKAHIRFHFDQAGGMEVIYRTKQEKLSFKHNVIEITSELETYLDKLIRKPIA